MKRSSVLFTFSLLLFTSSAAVPLKWTVETSRATPAQFEAYQGETLDLEATLQSYGKPVEMTGLAAIYWQTNGMGSAYWEASAAVNSNRMSAVWTPEMDVGAKVYNCFIGQPGTIYHAAFQLRLRPSPGADPNTLPLPTPVIDFAKVRVLNPPWEGGGGGGVKTNAVIDIVNATIETNRTVGALADSVSTLTSSVSGLQSSKLDGPTDTTLTLSGKAADAKATGDALAGKLNIGDVIDPASATTTGKAADALNVNQALAAKRGMTERVWLELQPKFLPITDPTPSYDLSSHYFERWAGGGFVLRDANGVNIAQFTEEGVFDGMHGAISTLYGGKNYMQWSALGTPVSLDTLALTSEFPAPYTPPPYLRVYDEVRQCWWLGRMVNGVINWEVE